MEKKWQLKRTKQCAKCPWKKTTNPYDIPYGYSREKHLKLSDTIANQYDYDIANKIKVMACHEEYEAHCVGWLYNQIGVGNNISLRFDLLRCSNTKNIEVFGEQHRNFEDTIPK